MTRRTTMGVAALVCATLLTACTARGTTTPFPTPTGATQASGSHSGAGDQPAVAAFDPQAHEKLTATKAPDRQPAGVATASPSGYTAALRGQGMQRYLDHRLAWRDCGTDQKPRQCATVAVPLDWDQPDGPAITLAVQRRRATGTAKGSLFINPGGPGASGLQMLDSFKASAFPDYDVVAWDPRGTGSSTPVRCGTPAETDTFFGLDSSPDSPKEWTALIDGTKAFARQCRQGSGELLDHVSTIDTARDLDYLRHLVGDDKLTYLGISYGTYLGAVYAELYPTRVNRMVLDSAVDITDADMPSQVVGFEHAFDTFAQWCAGHTDTCSLGASAEDVTKRTSTFLHGLDAHPLTVGGRQLTQTLATTGIAAFLYGGTRMYPHLATVLAQAIAGNGGQLLAAADFLNGRGAGGSYDTIAYAFPAIGCLDGPSGGIAQAKADWQVDCTDAPVLGENFGVSLVCALWTAKPVEPMRITAKGAPPILVLGATGDPATPYEQAVAMADQLDSGVLVTWKGAGHSAWELGNRCLTQAVEGYLNRGVVPRNGLTC